MMICLEVCVDNIESLLTAQKNGADRIELCSALLLGGLTPSYGLMQQAMQLATVPVYAMIRPRTGDFCFSSEEVALMLQDIAVAKKLGLQGVVVGILDQEGLVPEAILRQFVQAAHPMGVTFHRAIDVSSDWRRDIETIIAAGCERILSSGHAATALAGLEMLQEMQNAIAGRIQLMPGAGINAENVQTVLEFIGATEVHMSGMGFRGSAAAHAVTMGASDDGTINITDGAKVAAVRALLSEAHA
ncbi:MAG: copper homeostasis protein CutC [Vibrionaceae bacterium]